MRRLRWAIGIAGVFSVAACTSAAPAAQHASVAPDVSVPRTTASDRVHAAKVHAANRLKKPAAIISRFKAADGTVVTLVRFAGAVHYRLHSGSVDPGPAALPVVHAGPRIGSGERRQLLAAFNGGFLLSAGAGGYEQEGHVISPLRRGRASLVIDRSGTAYIGAWGSGLPRPHEAVFSVRQNLQLLVRQRHATRAAADWTAWGATLGGGEYVARSALGQNAAGDLIFAAAMSTTPADLAAALVRAGARTAMELDINPEWVQLDVARTAGRGLRAAIPGQVRPADQYLVGWTRDFITVLAA
ncbi:MAG: phosphodiester glycosidase family protein [Streptosporangiaceae bacterium]|jgi:hypothetical protein